MKKSTAHLERDIDNALRKPSKGGVARAAKKANDAIFDFITNKYFQAIPLTEIFAIVERAGLNLDDEEQQCILCGRDGTSDWQLYDPATGKEVDHKLVMTWHKMESGRYEVVAYVS